MLLATYHNKAAAKLCIIRHAMANKLFLSQFYFWGYITPSVYLESPVLSAIHVL